VDLKTLLTAVISFAIGAWVSNSPVIKQIAKLEEITGNKIGSVELKGKLTSSYFLVLGRKIVCHIEAVGKDSPDRVQLDYVDPASHRLIKTDTINLTTNQHGAKFLETTIPEFETWVMVEIKSE